MEQSTQWVTSKPYQKIMESRVESNKDGSVSVNITVQ